MLDLKGFQDWSAMMKVKASDLADALKPAKPHSLKKRPKPLLVSLEHELVAGTLAVIEAKHGAFAKSVPASGEWPGPVQVDGVTLYRFVATWPPETELELSTDAQALTLRMGSLYAASPGPTAAVLTRSSGPRRSVTNGTRARSRFRPTRRSSGWNWRIRGRSVPGCRCRSIATQRIVGDRA